MSIRVNTLTSSTIGQIRTDRPDIGVGTLPIKLLSLYLLMYLKYGGLGGIRTHTLQILSLLTLPLVY